MTAKQTAKQWPNRLGWDVGAAEVWNVGEALKVSAPIKPRRFVSASGKPREVDRVKVCLVPLGTDPNEAVKRCRRAGITKEFGEALTPRHCLPFLEA